MINQWLEIIPDKYAEQIVVYELDRLEEIRLCVGQPLTLRFSNREERLWPRQTQEDLEQVLASACRQSVYSHTETIRQGYITIEGGHRIGICGFGIYSNSAVKTIMNISSLVIRVAHQVIGCANELMEEVEDSVLIIGPPGSGKTTLLRDVIRQISDKKKQRVGLADERGELSAGAFGVPQLDIGSRTDVLINLPKNEAAMMLLRTMNPQWIAMDEITSPEDIAVMDKISYCGVSLLATAHAENPQELDMRPLYKELLKKGIFSKVVVLNRDKNFYVQEVSN